VQAVLAEHAAGGAPVLFSSHQLDIVERICDDLVVIADGASRASGSREQLRETHSEPRFEIEVSGDAGWVRDVPEVSVVDLDGGYALFQVERGRAGRDAAQSVLRRALDAGPVARFTPVHPTLSQIFTEVVK
jgi:ABC-2 type transport system ATP-binding protein